MSEGEAARLAGWWRRARRAVVLTGAGLSTASGIPDFRSPGGLWERFRAVTIDEFLTDPAARIGYWTYKTATWQATCGAEPNAAHHALADLGRAGMIELLVTQNIDGLHERSGFPGDRLIRIHGSDAEAACLECGRRSPRRRIQALWERDSEPPRCDCGGWWKPATVSFGQSLDMADLQRAFATAEGCDLLVAAGTSLVVGPINAMVPAAADAGARIAILTASETPFDHLAHVRLGEPVEEILPALRDMVMGPED